MESLNHKRCSFCGEPAHYSSILGLQCHAHFEEVSRQCVAINQQRPFGGRYRVTVASREPLMITAVESK